MFSQCLEPTWFESQEHAGPSPNQEPDECSRPVSKGSVAAALPLGLRAPAGLSNGNPTMKGNVLLFLELWPEGRATA